jgi:hypothetical protein
MSGSIDSGVYIVLGLVFALLLQISSNSFCNVIMHQVALFCFSFEVCHGSLKPLLQLIFIFLMLVAWCWGGDRLISNDDKSAFACNE